MKINSNERPNPADPEQPLPVGSSSDARSRRSKRRRRSAKPAVEKNIQTEPVETEIRPNEVRLIWDREQPATLQQSVLKTSAEKVPPATETRPKKTRETAPKPEPISEPAKPKLSRKENAAAPFADFQKRLDDLAAEQRVEPVAEMPPMAVQETARGFEPAKAPEAFEQPMTSPSLPPEASNYRHFFWNEPAINSPAENAAEHATLPSVSQPEQPAAVYDAPEQSQANQSNVAANWLGRTPESERISAPEVTSPQPEALAAAPPALEAVPLHEAQELQFPERMPGARYTRPEATLNVMQTPETQTAIASKPAAEAAEQSADSDSLGFADLMKLAKKIKIDGIKLSEIFIARRIDEAGLRAVIQTYLRGGDMRKQLTSEIINYEKSFERDPQLRHQSSGQGSAKLARASVGAIRTGRQLGAASQKAGRKTAHALKDVAARAVQELEHTEFTPQRLLSIAAIGVIYLLIIILLLT